MAIHNVRPQLVEIKDEIVAYRRHLHQNPELSGQEYMTQQYILDTLKSFGIEGTKVADTGVVATIKGHNPGKTIALRADIDALKVCQTNDVEYKSKVDGVMHACGHDGHTAILLGAAKVLNDLRSELNGSVRLIFQPAEEAIGGAKRMIDQGCLEDVVEVYGLHLWGAYPLGEIRTKSGPIMATNNEIQVTIKGKSGHGAMPHQGVDSIVVAAQFISSIQSIVSRSMSPFSSSVISFGTISGGTAGNVVAPEVKLTGTIRSMDDDDKARLVQRINEVLDGTTKAFGASGSLNVVQEGAYPALVNAPVQTSKVLKIASELVGHNNVGTAETMGAEDFSYFAKEVPGSYFFVGAGNKERGIIYPQHHSKFDIDEDSLLIGAEMFIRIALQS